MSIELNDAWKTAKREFSYNFGVIQTWPYPNSDMHEAFLAYLMKNCEFDIQRWYNLFDVLGYQLKAPGKISYPAPKFKSGLINYRGVAQEAAEIAEWMGLTGNDPEIVLKRAALKKRVFECFSLEPPADEFG